MIQSLFQAASAGFSSKQILDYLMRKFPHYRETIQKSLSSGFTAEQILKYLTGGRKEANRYDTFNKTELEQTTDLENKRRSNIYRNVGTGLSIAGTALGGAGLTNQLLKRAAPSVATAAEAVMPEVLSAPSPVKALPGPEVLQTEAQVISPQIPPVQAEATQPPRFDAISFIKQLGPRAENFIQSTKENAPENIARALEFYQFLTPENKKLIKQSGVPFEEIIKEYLVQQSSKDPEPIDKVAVFPDGKLGKIQAINDGVADVKVGDKVEKRKVTDLIESPLPEKDLADLYDQLVAKIPEKARSSQIFWAGYDENTNKLAFIPHGGSLYTYEDIPREFAEKLKNAMFQAKTTGQSKHGMWVAGGESRGAGLYQLIKDLQAKYGGKGKEYIEKYASVYDYFSLPREESRKKEKERKQREKDEKRKKRQ